MEASVRNDKLLTLVDRLLTQSERGSLIWSRSAERDAYQISFPRSSEENGPPSRHESATVGRQPAAGPLVRLWLLNGEGERVASVSDADLAAWGEDERRSKLFQL